MIIRLTAGAVGAALGVLIVFVAVVSLMPGGGDTRHLGARKE
jgi:hypothetical protein